MNKPIVRSSSLPLLMVCTPAVLNPDGLQVVESENEPAVLGTLVHSLCQQLVDSGSVGLGDLRDRLSNDDYERAGLLFSNFLTVWTSAKQYMKHPQTEVAFEAEFPGFTLSGHIDCLHRDLNRAFILDYKTGRTHEDHYHQMAAYAYGVWSLSGKPEDYAVYVSCVYLEDNSVHPYAFTASGLEAWAREIGQKVQDVRYVVGRKCAGCTLQDTCPAYRVYASNAKAILGGGDLPDWRGLGADERGRVVDQMYVLDKALDRVRLALRNEVKAKGNIDIGQGKEMVLVSTEDRLLDVEKAIPILSKRIGTATVHQNARVPLETVLAAYAAKAAKGSKAKARGELLAELEAAGAIQRVKSTKMFRRPKNEQTLEV